MKRLTMLLVPLLTVGSLTAAAQSGDTVAKIKGKGVVTMTATGDDTFLDPPAYTTGDVFIDNDFVIEGKVKADGSACGTATFVFGQEFSASYEVDVITLECEIDTGSVSEDGTVVLQGLSFEEDFIDGVVVFEELSPFEIIFHPDGSSTLRWCEIPTLDLEIAKGHLKVK